MTMEMWSLGSTIPPLRLALFLVAMFPVLGRLAYYAGFEKSFGWLDFRAERLRRLGRRLPRRGDRPRPPRSADARGVDPGDRRQAGAPGGA